MKQEKIISATNFLPSDKILDLNKLKTLSDDKLYIAKMMIALFDRVENTMGKKIPSFSSFSTVFSKAFILRVVKSRNCVVKG